MSAVSNNTTNMCHMHPVRLKVQSVEDHDAPGCFLLLLLSCAG
jgi:hypothetical protein